ncbi:MAG TPA: 3-hydroxyacyl-CoA dehydrogenase, partial [Clostridiales bacterium]|nr:3-hydroxyacyl-CoA dehydrogenase [Clostridiales bacterium]
FAMKGLETNLFDIDEEKLDQAVQIIKRNLKFLYEERIITDREFKLCIERITTTTDLEKALKDVVLVQENGPENYEVKRKIVKDIESFCSKDSIIASSTSGLLITEIAKDANYPERILGAHPYNPVQLIPLVEITKGELTSDLNVVKAVDFYKAIDKEPIVLRKEALGFISNRLAMALYREAVEMVERGICTVEEVDKACCFGPGLRYALMGPNLIYQLGGGNYGIRGALTHMGPSVEQWWADMADWKTWPDGYAERVQQGVNEEMEYRSKFSGNTNEEIAMFRDKGLIMLLKYHGKI